MKAFATLDVKAKCFLRPFFETNSFEALRGFQAATNKEGTSFNLYPDDFCLMELGELDTVTGMLIPHDSPLNLGSARTVLQVAQ